MSFCFCNFFIFFIYLLTSITDSGFNFAFCKTVGYNNGSLNSTQHILHYWKRRVEFILMSEIKSLIHFYSFEDSYSRWNFVDLLLSHSGMHPAVSDLLTAKARYMMQHTKVVHLEDTFTNSFVNLRERLSKELDREEILLLFKSLRNCTTNKVALLLPQYQSERFASKLRKLEEKHVFVGKEALVNFSITFNALGLVPPYITRRIKGIGAAGMWDRWNRLARNSFVKDKWRLSSKDLATPDMEGHMSIVFVVLVIGEIVAVTGLIMEVTLVLIRKVRVSQASLFSNCLVAQRR